MAKNSVLRKIGAGSKAFQIKIPVELFERIAAVREKAKDLGLQIDIDDPATRAIRQVVELAEEELKGLSPAPKPEPVPKAEDKPLVKPPPVPAKAQEVSHAASQVR